MRQHGEIQYLRYAESLYQALKPELFLAGLGEATFTHLAGARGRHFKAFCLTGDEDDKRAMADRLNPADNGRWCALPEDASVCFVELVPTLMDGRSWGRKQSSDSLVRLGVRVVVATKAYLSRHASISHVDFDAMTAGPKQDCFAVLNYQLFYAYPAHVVSELCAVHPSLRGKGIMSNVNLRLLNVFNKHLPGEVILKSHAVHRSTARAMAVSDDDMLRINARIDSMVDPSFNDGRFKSQTGLDAEAKLEDVVEFQVVRHRHAAAERAMLRHGSKAKLFADPFAAQDDVAMDGSLYADHAVLAVR